MARVGVPVFVLLAAVIGVFATIGSRGDTELVAAGNGSPAANQRVWVIPTFLNGPLEALDIMDESPRPPDGSAVFEYPGDPDLNIMVFRQADGVFSDSGTPVDINGVDGYVQIEESILLTDIEWRVGNPWQVFQARGLSDADAIDAARKFQSDGADGLAGLGWRQISEPEPQEIVTIISPDNGVLVFQDEPSDGPMFDTAAAESNGFKVYAPANAGSQLFVTYRGRHVFSYTSGGTARVIDPTALADGLEIVTEEQWRAWLDTWSIMGGTPKVSGGQFASAAATWINQLGLAQTDDTVWSRRLGMACTEGVWNPDVALRLAQQFIDEDLALSVRAAGRGKPTAAEGAKSLWIMAAQVCPEAFPDGAIAAGPSSTGSDHPTESGIGEAVRRFCTEEFDCASAPVLYIVSSHIDSNTELGGEVTMDPAVRAAIESALGRPLRWLQTSAEVDAAVNESPSPTILTIGTPVFLPHVLEIDIGWSRGQFEGKRVTVRVGLDDQAGNTPETPRTTSVP